MPPSWPQRRCAPETSRRAPPACGWSPPPAGCTCLAGSSCGSSFSWAAWAPQSRRPWPSCGPSRRRSLAAGPPQAPPTWWPAGWRQAARGSRGAAPGRGRRGAAAAPGGGGEGGRPGGLLPTAPRPPRCLCFSLWSEAAVMADGGLWRRRRLL